SVATIVGSTRRITFQVAGPNVSAPTPYLVSISGVTSTGANFVSGNQASLTITPGASILAVLPSSGQAASSVGVNVAGQYTNFAEGFTPESFGPGIPVGGGPVGGFGPVLVTNPLKLTAQLTIDPAAAVGPRTVTVATGTQQAALVNGFTVNPPTP